MLPSLSAPASRNRTAACTKPSSSSARAKSRAVYWWLPCGWFFASQTRAEASSRLLMSSGSADGAGVGGRTVQRRGARSGSTRGKAAAWRPVRARKARRPTAAWPTTVQRPRQGTAFCAWTCSFSSCLLFGHILPWKTPGVQCIGRFFKQILRILRFFA